MCGESGGLASVGIYIIDKQAFFLQGLAFSLRNTQDFEIVGTATGEGEIPKGSREPDIAIVDYDDDGLTGSLALDQLSDMYPNVRGLLTLSENQCKADSITAGLVSGILRGFILRSSREQTILAAIRAIHAGLSIADPVIAAELSAQHQAQAMSVQGISTEPDAPLSKREREALQHAMKPIKEAAKEMLCSHHTLRNIWQSIFRKVGLRSRAEVYLWAMKQGYIGKDES